ncbi:MAG: 3-hydroxyacyl-CoA dehydrogenase NAD-binding domain-containing protein [Bdellovibrionota bacterium]
MKIGVAGAGTMGQGIAQLAASSGATVVVSDRSSAALAALKPNIEKLLQRKVDKGTLEKAKLVETLSRLHTSPDLRSFDGCDLVIEAITENLGLKQELLKAIEQQTSDSCLIATNTSSLSVTAIASACKRAHRVLGLHFFNPAPVMPLVELVHALQSSDETLKRGEEMVASWGKTVIRVQDTPAFVVNRIARPFYGEALRIFEEGIADPPTIDWAMKQHAFKMGPFELMDFIGIDVNYAVTESVFESFYYDSRYRPSLLQRKMVEAGRLGRKTGLGFFDYRSTAAEPHPKTDARLGSDIFDRIFALLVNEAIDAVFWGIASPEAIEQAVTLGVNYPKGLLRWGEEYGLERILLRLEALQSEYREERYRPCVMLKRMVRDQGTFFGVPC